MTVAQIGISVVLHPRAFPFLSEAQDDFAVGSPVGGDSELGSLYRVNSFENLSNKDISFGNAPSGLSEVIHDSPLHSFSDQFVRFRNFRRQSRLRKFPVQDGERVRGFLFRPDGFGSRDVMVGGISEFCHGFGQLLMFFFWFFPICLPHIHYLQFRRFLGYFLHHRRDGVALDVFQLDFVEADVLVQVRDERRSF